MFNFYLTVLGSLFNLDDIIVDLSLARNGSWFSWMLRWLFIWIRKVRRNLIQVAILAYGVVLPRAYDVALPLINCHPQDGHASEEPELIDLLPHSAT